MDQFHVPCLYIRLRLHWSRPIYNIQWNIQWDTQDSTVVEDQQFMCIIQDNFLTQHVLEPTKGARVLDLVLSSQKEFVDNIKIQEPSGSSDHNQLHFNIKIKSDKTKVSRCGRNFRKGNYKEMRTILAHIDWNDKMKNKTRTESGTFKGT